MKIVLAGDLSPQKRAAELIDSGENEMLFGEVQPIIASADYSIVNLEAPIVNGLGKPIEKAGPNLKCSNKVIQSLQYCGFDCVTLANNHFYDYGEEGALNTFKELQDAGIDFVGAGTDLNEASKSLFKTIKNKTFAFINCCEHEYSIATDETAGSNPLNPIQQYYKIQEAKEKADYIIIIIHGGIEMYQLPSLRMQNTYRFFIDAGADVVINHHQHCFSGYEIYKGKPIFYGLGNFCFDWIGRQDSIWNQGYLVSLVFGKEISFEIVPYIQCNKEALVKLLNSDELKSFNLGLNRLCSIIQNKHELKSNYELFLKRTDYKYKVLSPYTNKYLKILFKKGYLPSFIPKSVLRIIQNYISCESHCERFLHSISSKLEKS